MGALIRVTTWEKVSPGRRILAAFVRVFVLIALLLVLGSIYFVNRFRLEAKIWHWKHGYSATMGNYEVPVPRHWLITDQDNVAFTLMNTAPTAPKDAKLHTTAVVTVFPFRNRTIGTEGLAFWLSLQ